MASPRFIIVLCLAMAVLVPATLRGESAEPPSLTHGPMLGQPTATTMKVWGRTSMPTKFTVRYGSQPLR